MTILFRSEPPQGRVRLVFAGEGIDAGSISPGPRQLAPQLSPFPDERLPPILAGAEAVAWTAVGSEQVTFNASWLYRAGPHSCYLMLPRIGLLESESAPIAARLYYFIPANERRVLNFALDDWEVQLSLSGGLSLDMAASGNPPESVSDLMWRCDPPRGETVDPCSGWVLLNAPAAANVPSRILVLATLFGVLIAIVFETLILAAAPTRRRTKGAGDYN